MVIAGMINRVAFYCRVNHRDRDYEKYLDDVMRRLEEEYGKQKWGLQIFFEEASGADPNRKEFNRLKAEIAAKKIDVVVTMRAATIARNWGQFIEFMLICSKRNVEVVCIDKVEDTLYLSDLRAVNQLRRNSAHTGLLVRNDADTIRNILYVNNLLNNLV